MTDRFGTRRSEGPKASTARIPAYWLVAFPFFDPSATSRSFESGNSPAAAHENSLPAAALSFSRSLAVVIRASQPPERTNPAAV